MHTKYAGKEVLMFRDIVQIQFLFCTWISH